MSTTSTDDANVVTDERALMLAQHAIYVQGGVSDPERERARAEADIAAGGTIDWAKMQSEVDEAIAERIAKTTPAAAPEPAAAEQTANVTAVMTSVDKGEALRDRIRDMQAELKIHEDNIKDALGAATVGVDDKGHVVVRYPFRNRSGLVKEKVKAKLSAADYADCETVTTYRSLHYGES
jgi:hypothetical protein